MTEPGGPIEIDFTGVSANAGYQPLEPGDYKAVVTKVDMAGKTRKNQDCIICEFTYENTNNRKTWKYWMYKDPQGLPYMKADLLEMGYPSDKLEGRLVFDPNELLGKTYIVTLITKPKWNAPGEMDNEMEKVRPDDGMNW